MSGMVGIINLDGAPVAATLLAQMTESLAFRGPDAQKVWVKDCVGFGHTLLRTTYESAQEQQPCSLDGQVWIVADARIDGREELVRKLTAKGCQTTLAVPDVELILQAYRVWGEDCVAHLLGDFAFAIWDERQQRLFCARDHFGVKPFYYAHLGACLVFSNTLNCVRLHPAVTDRLNDLAIADFLLFGFNYEPATSTFADIQRLPPATTLVWSEGALRLQRYWQLPEDDQIRYRRTTDYVEHFLELLKVAVEDRLRTNRAWVWMSGGLDSTSIAALAHEQLSKQGKAFDLRACTEVYDTLIPHDERRYASLVAESLGIPIHYQVLDNYRPFERWEEAELQKPEPSEICLSVTETDEYKLIAAHSRVVFCGYGGDPAFYGDSLTHLLGRVSGPDLLADTMRHLRAHHQLPPLGIRSWLKNLLKEDAAPASYPTWLNKTLADQLKLPSRWQRLMAKDSYSHVLRSRAHQELSHPFWAYRFESHDPGVMRYPVEARYPFFDKRLLVYLLAIPSLPWCANKKLLRESMRGILPESVRLRPKTSLAADPIQSSLRRSGTHWINQFTPAPSLDVYVNSDKIPQLTGQEDLWSLWVNIRVFCLNHWLQHHTHVNQKLLKEQYYELST